MERPNAIAPENKYWREDINPNVEKVKKAMLFYMLGHSWKGFVYDTDPETDIEGIERNYREFLEAVEAGDEREILAEGIGVINHTWMAIAKLAPDELEAMKNWERILDSLGGKL